MKIKDKILIIEDEASISSFIATVLAANNYDTMIAHTGSEAICEARPQNDISFLESAADESFLIAKEGFFAVFFPWDAHRPGLILNECDGITVIVIG